MKLLFNLWYLLVVFTCIFLECVNYLLWCWFEDVEIKTDRMFNYFIKLENKKNATTDLRKTKN